MAAPVVKRLYRLTFQSAETFHAPIRLRIR